MMEDHKESSYLLVNTTEQVVRKKVRELMEQLDMCQCEKCFLDTCAMVLNQMSSHYVTTRKGELLTLLDANGFQYRTNLTVCVLQMLKRVKEQPKH